MATRPTKRTHLDRDRLIEWSQMGHAFYLSALMAQSQWTVNEIAFHGGTSLHMSWQSARFSEDLDFLISRETTNVGVVSRRVLNEVRMRFVAVDPEFRVDLRDKTRDPARMHVFVFSIAHPAYLGTAKFRVEFWCTESEYLSAYPTQLRTPVLPHDLLPVILNPVPVASLETAFADKLTAFATRPHVKWRDIYDLWWIGTQSRAQIIPERAARQFLHNVSAYETLGRLPPIDALRLFLAQDDGKLFGMADPDIRRWLPDNVWRAMYPEGVRQMLAYTRSAIETVAAAIDAAPVAGSQPDRAPRVR